MKKLKLLRFPSFWFGPIAKIKKLEISKSFLLLQSMALILTQDLKQKKNWDKN